MSIFSTLGQAKLADIWGEGDPFHIGSLIDMAKGGFYVRIGNGSSKSQHVNAGNMAVAHIQAARALIDGNSRVGGQACCFFHGGYG
jgi:hypothetical protein